MVQSLGLALIPSSGDPLYRQIFDQIVERVRAGAFPAGYQLPPTRELARALDRALRELPEEFREAAMLRDVEGMSYDEIAGVLGCPLGTVESRLNAARKRLQAVALEWMGEKKI